MRVIISANNLGRDNPVNCWCITISSQERDETSASYNHALYLKERRAMMQAWAEMLDAMRDDTGKVVPGKFGKVA